VNGVPGGIRTRVTAVKRRSQFVTYRKLRHGWLCKSRKDTLGDSYRTLIAPFEDRADSATSLPPPYLTPRSRARAARTRPTNFQVASRACQKSKRSAKKRRSLSLATFDRVSRREFRNLCRPRNLSTSTLTCSLPCRNLLPRVFAMQTTHDWPGCHTVTLRVTVA
jgi:hypothetical protein